MADRFRAKYVQLSKTNQTLIEIVKRTAEQIAAVLEDGQSRELSLALTKLEESVFWATKHFSAPERN